MDKSNSKYRTGLWLASIKATIVVLFVPAVTLTSEVMLAPAACAAPPAAEEHASAAEQSGCDIHMHDGDNAPMMRFDNLRGVGYCEISLLCGGAGATMYNTTGLNNQTDPNNTCPAGLWANVSEGAMAQQFNVPGVWKNGPRGWTVDWIELPVGTELDFNGLKARWLAYPNYPPNVQQLGITAGSYITSLIERKSKIGFVKGKPIFTLIDPSGTPWVMQAWSAQVDPSITYESLISLGGKLTLPAGWSYRVIVLEKDLEIQALPNGMAPVTQDSLGNSYDGCIDTACSYNPAAGQVPVQVPGRPR